MDSKISVVILAAGMGTRMKSKKAKVLHRAGGMTLIEHVVAAAGQIAEPSSITVVIGHQADEVRRVLAHAGVAFAVQTDQKGTGHAVKICRDQMLGRGDFVVVLYGDGPLLSVATLRRLVEQQAASGAGATLITTKMDDPTGYGRAILNELGHVTSIIEEKACTPEQRGYKLANSGIYCFRADLLWKYIDEIQTNNPAGEFYLTDMAEVLTRAGFPVAAMEVEDSEELLGINTRVELANIDRIFRERKARELMLEGVTIEKPETVTIDLSVRIGMDTIVEPFTRILGNTVIGEDCRIGSGSIVENSQLGDRVHIAALTIVGNSRIDADAQVGPFARLRPANHVEKGAHIGNFVELKKTRLGAGAKASHLAYLGDAIIGENVNIGAGTIVCNYDGVKKHQTVIGKNAFVGSNSTLVAPVEVGEGSYIAAGSVITDPVPEGALGLGRGRQVVKEGWAAARRKKS